MRSPTHNSFNPVLITGSTGQIGGELVSLFVPFGERFGQIHAPTRDQLDLADPASIRSTIRFLRPRWIINPAAYTAVDKAESEPGLAHAINAEAPRILGEEAHRIGAAIIHFSTDNVFDGDSPRSYLESDPTNPLGVYGASKLAGEQALAATEAAHIILRTSWVYGATGKNFLRTILKLAGERTRLNIVSDQHGAPTWSHDLARLAAHIVAHCETQSSGRQITLNSGTYHAAAQGETTWHGFASEAVRLANLPNAAILTAIPTSDYPTPARRPANSRLNCEKLYRTFGFRLPPWQQSLTTVVSQLSSISNG